MFAVAGHRLSLPQSLLARACPDQRLGVFCEQALGQPTCHVLHRSVPARFQFPRGRQGHSRFELGTCGQLFVSLRPGSRFPLPAGRLPARSDRVRSAAQAIANLRIRLYLLSKEEKWHLESNR